MGRGKDEEDDGDADEEDEDEDINEEENFELNENDQYGPFASFEKSATENTIFESLHKTTQLIIKEKSGKTITRLKQPRDLYAVSKRTSPQLNPRWPADVQVLAQAPRHIHTDSYQDEISPKTFKETKPSPRSSDIFGKVVYDNSPNPEIRYFTRAKCSNKIGTAKPYYQLQGADDHTLIFESRFESGNLMRAIKLGDCDYELWLRFDLYTKKHTQWYYFQVKNTRPSMQYRFTIMNFIKTGSLYNMGMRPLIYSEHDAKTKGIGWTRVGTKIKYYKNDIIFTDRGRERNYYSLTWTCSFPNENDTYYFAHCYPYTYSDLQEHLAALASDPVRSRCFKQRILCRTLAGNLVHVLTITAPTKRRDEAELKKAVVITARVHPGESNSSWMMKGFLDFLTSNLQDAKILRDNFIFKIVPMLNPDGVIVGNYRCSLAGRDLNRNYKTVLKESFPSIWHTRAMIKKLQEEREVLLYCDLHGHSRKRNVFIYGCDNKQNKTKRFWGRVFPMMLCKNSEDKFAYKSCRFKVQKSKEGTGRIFMWNVGIPYSFTLEASFCGSSLGKRKDSHFGISDYESMAYHFCDTLLDFCDPDQSKFYAILADIEKSIQSAILKRLLEKNPETSASPQNISVDDNLNLLSELETDSGGSDSSVSDGLPMQLLHASVPELSRRKRLKSKKERNRSRLRNSRDTNRMSPSSERSKLSVSARTAATKSDPKAVNLTPNSAQFIGRTGYKKREKETTQFAAPVPHCVRDRLESKGKLKKEYLETLTNSLISNGAGEFLDLRDIPHCRYTAGISSLYQNERHCLTCERCCKSMSDGSDEDVHYVTYNNCDGSQPYSEALGQLYGSESNANTVLDLAKRITVYNHRRNQLATSSTRRPSMPPELNSQSKAKSDWQTNKRRGLNQTDDYELFSVNENETGAGSEYSESLQEKRLNTAKKQQFIINREERQTGRVNNHFDIQKSSSGQASQQQQQYQQQTTSSSEMSQLRRLPQLKKKENNFEDDMGIFYGKETPASNRQDEIFNRYHRYQQSQEAKHRANDSQGSFTDTQPANSPNNPRLSKDEIEALLKRKMQALGKKSTLLDYAAPEDSSKRSNPHYSELMNKETEHLKTKPSSEYRPKAGTCSSSDELKKLRSLFSSDEMSRRDIERFVEKERSFVLSKPTQQQYETKGCFKAGSFHGLRDFDKTESFQRCIDLRGERDRMQEILRKQSLMSAKRDVIAKPGNASITTDSQRHGFEFARSNTMGDLQSQGLVTLNLNLNISPVVYKDSRSPNILKECSKKSGFIAESKNSTTINDTELHWPSAKAISSTDSFTKTMPISLSFNGSTTAAKQPGNSPKNSKVNPPQLRHIKRPSRS
eukprot:gene18239-20058_t